MCTPVTHDVLEEFLEIGRLEHLDAEHLILEHMGEAIIRILA